MPRRGRSQDTMAPTKKSAGGISILTAVEEHEEHQQQAAAGHEERQVHARLQDRPQDPLELQGNLHSGMVVEASKLSPAGAVWIEFGLTFFMAVLVMLNMAELSPAGEAPTQGMFDLNVKDKWDAWKAIQAKLDCSKIQGGRHGRLHHQVCSRTPKSKEKLLEEKDVMPDVSLQALSSCQCACKVAVVAHLLVKQARVGDWPSYHPRLRHHL